MNKPDFAELKEKLIRFDSDDITLNKMIKDENYAWAAYDKMSHIEKVEAHDALLDIANYQHTKSAAIITELLEIIQSQSEALKFYKGENESDSELDIFDHFKCDHKGNSEFDSEWLCKKARESLSETTARLQKLREGR